jgi:DNA-binding transcriptional ArsR family regulator
VEDLDELLRALAHPARRAILRLCDRSWVAAGDLVEELGLAPATVSEHLRVLRKTELVDMKIDGTWRRYRTRPITIRSALHTLKSELP